MFGVMVVVVLALAPLPGEAGRFCVPWPDCLYNERSDTGDISSCLNTDACTKVVCGLLILYYCICSNKHLIYYYFGFFSEQF